MQEMNWISVKDDLPPYGQPVIICRPYSKDCLKVEQGCRDLNDWWRAGNPQKAALDALADTDGLTDAVLLDALGVEQWGDLPTVPYPDASMWTQPDNGGQGGLSGQSGPAARPRKKPGPKPGIRRKPGPKAKAPTKMQPAPSASGTLRDALGRALGGLEEFASVWDGVLTDPHGPFTTDQVEALAQINETASIWLNGWDAAAMILMGGDKHE